MTDAELVSKKLAVIRTKVADLRTVARLDQLETDIREQGFVLHSLQIAIQAALDVASHAIADDALGEPTSNRELFLILARRGWYSRELGDRLARMAGFRSLLVHGYAELDLARVRDVAEHHLGDLEAFAAALHARIASANGR